MWRYDLIKDKRISVLIILILVSLITLVGSSYALFTKSFKGNKESMQIGTLKVDFTEGNYINMNNAIPMSDSNGKETTPYTFTITNSGTIDAYYTISTEDDVSNTLDTNYLKMKITSSDGYDSGVIKINDLSSKSYRIVDDKILKTGHSVTYKLYMWISEEADNSIQGKIYKSKIVVNSASNKESLEKKCQAYGGKYVDNECRKYYVKLNNMIENPSFSNNAWNWVIHNSKLSSVNNNEVEIDCTNNNQTSCGLYQQPLEKIQLGHKYYASQTIKSPSSTKIFELDLENVKTNFYGTLNDNDWHTYSSIIEATEEIKNVVNTTNHAYVIYSRNEFETKFYSKNPIFLDLTLMFGEGNEPDIGWCDKNLTRYIEYNETGIKTFISNINYDGKTSYYDVINIDK
mgnify:FL=1|jgi:hypothetical protein